MLACYVYVLVFFGGFLAITGYNEDVKREKIREKRRQALREANGDPSTPNGIPLYIICSNWKYPRPQLW
jgi:hypothetical protein